MCQRRNNREIRKFQETNRNENITYQNVWDAETRGTFTAINKYIKKEEKSRTNKLTLELRSWKKKRKLSQIIIRKEVMKIMARISKI